ncbi:hypothetical protein TSAR_015404 [Trichomalopsis sarcophagae]|uniref:Uncharacterized protein n=1 Tax=Trichomalopsis sarcophagae TaxID=543379 RepID=A0A232EGY5_9HYME|nr:hypothetical protein TSAR_015404 [Trichomalopsis sarcophagae]
MNIGLQFIIFVNFHDPKAEGLLNSNELTITSGFKGNAGLQLADKPRDFSVKSHMFDIADIAREGAKLRLLQTLQEFLSLAAQFGCYHPDVDHMGIMWYPNCHHVVFMWFSLVPMWLTLA